MATKCIAADKGLTYTETGTPGILFCMLTIDPALNGGSDLCEVTVGIVGDETLVQLKAAVNTAIQVNLTRLNTAQGLALVLTSTNIIMPAYTKG